MAKTIKVTEDGLSKLKAELETLKTVGRADIAENIKVYPVSDYVAEVDGKCYFTLEEALKALKSCDGIVLDHLITSERLFEQLSNACA